MALFYYDKYNAVPQQVTTYKESIYDYPPDSWNGRVRDIYSRETFRADIVPNRGNGYDSYKIQLSTLEDVDLTQMYVGKILYRYRNEVSAWYMEVTDIVSRPMECRCTKVVELEQDQVYTISYAMGDLIASNVQLDDTYPLNGKHTDGHWYIRKGTSPVETAPIVVPPAYTPNAITANTPQPIQLSNTTIKLNDVLKTYQRIDLYRAKYRHGDLTPHAWCFHGDRAQGWLGWCSNRHLQFNNYTTYQGTLSINASIYKYVTIGLMMSPPSPTLSASATLPTYQNMVSIQAYLINKGIDANEIARTSTLVRINGVDFVAEEAYVNGVSYASYNKLDAAWSNYLIYLSKLEHILKFTYTVDGIQYSASKGIIYTGLSKTEIFDMSDEVTWAGTITGLRFEIQTLNLPKNFTVMPVVCEYIKVDEEDVFAFVAKSKYSVTVDFNEMRDSIEGFSKNTISWSNPGTKVSPNRVRQFIDEINHNDLVQANSIITGLYPYNGCANCDDYQCSCYSRDYGHLTCSTCDGCNTHQGCSTCDNTCYHEATPCACNAKCYTQSTACMCNATCHGQPSACTCNGTCHGQPSVCTCNTTCHGQPSACTCNGICYQENVTCGCNATCHSQPSTCTCNQTCYGQPSACTCNETCHEQGRDCTCNQTCYGQARACTCDMACHSGYSNCSCDMTCHGVELACRSRYEEQWVKSVMTCDCNTSCHGYSCTIYAQVGEKACSQCHVSSDASCARTFTSNAGGRAYVGDEVRASGRYYYDSYGTQPSGTASRGIYSVTHTNYGCGSGVTKPVHIADGGPLGWMSSGSVSKLNNNTCSCNATCYQYNKNAKITCATCHTEKACTCDSKCNSGVTYNCTVCNTSCYDYGYVCDVGTYDTCYGYEACSTCDQKCYTEPLSCTCDAKCYAQTIVCTCNAKCYTQPSACTCDTRCFSQPGTCLCNATCYTEPGVCTTCDETCHTQPGPCTCNAMCHSQPSACVCNAGCYTQPGLCTCNTTCYTQALPCTCDATCHTQATPCTCYSTCDGYAGCSTCDSCYGYLKCSCDQTCYTESCAQCHNASYSSVPI